MINWVGARYLTDALTPRISRAGGTASIASTAGIGWKSNLERVKEFLGINGFAESRVWLEANPDLGVCCPSNGRFADPEEMAGPLVLLNSRLASFVSGNNLPVDFGYCAEVWMHQRDNLMGI